MKINKAIVFIFAVVLGMAIAIPTLRADQVIPANGPTLNFNEATRFNFSQPMEIPGQVLPAGTYWFIVADTADAHTVQIFDADKRLVTTLQTQTTYRYDTTEETLVTVADQGPGRPAALLNWFYPDFTEGHEFLYPSQERKAFEEDTGPLHGCRLAVSFAEPDHSVGTP